VTVEQIDSTLQPPTLVVKSGSRRINTELHLISLTPPPIINRRDEIVLIISLECLLWTAGDIPLKNADHEPLPVDSTNFFYQIPDSVELVEFLASHFRLFVVCHCTTARALANLQIWNENWRSYFSGYITADSFEIDPIGLVSNQRVLNPDSLLQRLADLNFCNYRNKMDNVLWVDNLRIQKYSLKWRLIRVPCFGRFELEIEGASPLSSLIHYFEQMIGDPLFGTSKFSAQQYVKSIPFTERQFSDASSKRNYNAPRVSVKKQRVIEVFADMKIENESPQTIAVEQLTLEKLEVAFRPSQTFTSRLHAAVNDLKKDLTRHQHGDLGSSYQHLQHIVSITNLHEPHQSAIQRLLCLVPENILDTCSMQAMLDDFEYFLRNICVSIRRRSQDEILFEFQTFVFCAQVGFESDNGYSGLLAKYPEVGASSFLPIRVMLMNSLPSILQQLLRLVRIWRKCLLRQHHSTRMSSGFDRALPSLEDIYPSEYALDLLCIYFYYTEFGVGHGSLTNVFLSFMQFISFKRVSERSFYDKKTGALLFSFHHKQFKSLYASIHASPPNPPEHLSSNAQIILLDPLIPNTNVLGGFRSLKHLRSCGISTLEIWRLSSEQSQLSKEIATSVFIEAMFVPSQFLRFSMSESWGSYVGIRGNFKKMVENTGAYQRKQWRLFRI